MSTYSPDLRIELITTGAQAGTWGTTTNTNLGTIIEDAISGYTTVSVISANQAFTAVDGAADEARNAMIRLTTTTTADFAVYAPPNSKQYIIWNNSGYTATIYNSTVIGNTTAAGTGVAIADGDKVVVFTNGTNFYTVKTNNVTGTVAIANGGTGQTTANAAFNALAPSQASANGKYLKSDGTNTSWDAIDLSTGDISGTLPVANGGTGQTTANAAFNALAPSQASASGKYLKSDGTNTAWDQIDISTADITGTLPIANGGTNATTASGARTNLGLGTLATQDASAVSVTGGTMSGTAITQRVVAIADGTTVTMNADTTDIATQANTQAAGILTMNAPTGTPINGQKLLFRLTSSYLQTFGWNAIFTGSSDLPLPSAGSGSGGVAKTDYMGFIYNSTAAKWQLVGKVFGF